MHDKFFKNTLNTFIAQIAVFAFSFTALAVISRILGPEGRGIYALIILIPSLLIAFGSFGLDSSNTYFTGKKTYKTEDIVFNSVASSLFLGAVLIFVFYFLLQLSWFDNFLNTNKIPVLYLWISVLAIPFSLILAYFRGIICGKEKLADYNWTKIVEGGIEFLSVIVFVVFLKTELFGAVISRIIAVIAAAIFTIFLIKKISSFNFSFNKSLLKSSFIYGGKVYLANITSFLSYRIDMLIIAILLNPASVGLYSISVSMAEKLFMIPGAFATVLFPRISSIESKEANEFTPKIVRHTIFVMFLFSFILVFLSAPVIRIVFGSEFIGSVIPFIALLPGIIAYGAGGVLAADLSGRGKPQFAIYSTIVCLLINVPLNFLLIPKIGILGASISSTVAYLSDTLVVLIAFLIISKKPLTEVLIIKKEDFKDYINIFKHER